MVKTDGERRIELATWGLLLGWVGVTMVASFDNDVPGLANVVAGGIAGTSAVVQRGLRYSAGLMLWALAGVLLLTGMDDLLGTVETPIFSLVLIALGVFFLARGVMMKSWLRLVTGLFIVTMGLGDLLDLDLSLTAIVLIATGVWLLSRAFRRGGTQRQIVHL